MAAATAYRQIRQSWRHTGNRADRRSAVNTGFHGFSQPVYHISLRIKDGRGIDPRCGLGGMFVQSIKFVEAHSGNKKKISIYGQEYTNTTFKLAKMN